MKIPYKNIVDRLSCQPAIDELSDVLFQLGHEHEIIKESFHMEFTPNRGDCLSLDGIIRDLSVFYNTKEKLKIYKEKFKDFDFDFENKIKDKCSKISFLKIEVDNLPNKYRGDLEDYFSDSDNKKINFFTDISNYLSFETGQPTHCYDALSINGNVILEIINDEVEFKTLLDRDITLKGADAVFKIENEIINLAGVIGGKQTSCSDITKSVIVECAYFDPELIIGKSIKYDIQSDAAYKFERGVDPLNHEYVLRRFVQLVSENTNVVNVELFSEQTDKHDAFQFDFDYDVVKKIIGIDLKNEIILEHIEKLGFIIKDNIIMVPSYRSDIFTLNDIAEEVARVIGYNNIEPLDFEIPRDLKIKKSDEKIIKLKSFLIDNGLYEVINFPFVSEANEIKLDNSLDSNKSFFRGALKESLIDNLLYNERRQKDSIKLFEISNIYKYTDEIKSNEVLGIILSGRLGKNYKQFHKKINANYINDLLKDYIDERHLNIQEISRDNLNTKTKNKIIYFEVEIDKFSDRILDYESSSPPKDGFIQYQPISEYPSSTRDLSFSIEDFSQLKKLQDLLLSTEYDMLKEVFVFDYFEDKKNNLLKIGFRFIFQLSNKTITDKEVDNIMNKVIDNALTIKSVSIPGIK